MRAAPVGVGREPAARTSSTTRARAVVDPRIVERARGTQRIQVRHVGGGGLGGHRAVDGPLIEVVPEPEPLLLVGPQLLGRAQPVGVGDIGWTGVVVMAVPRRRPPTTPWLEHGTAPLGHLHPLRVDGAARPQGGDDQVDQREVRHREVVAEEAGRPGERAGRPAARRAMAETYPPSGPQISQSWWTVAPKRRSLGAGLGGGSRPGHPSVVPSRRADSESYDDDRLTPRPARDEACVNPRCSMTLPEATFSGS